MECLSRVVAKKTRGEILSSILEQLDTRPMTANEIADEIGSNWDTVKSNLEILDEIGLCSSVTEGKKKTVYSRTNSTPKGDERTWFKIPISDAAARKTELIFASAKKAWLKWAKKEPNRVQLEKTAFELVQTQGEKYDIPMGWYLYGPMAQMRIESMSFSGVDDHLVSQAKPIVEKQDKHKYSTSLIRDLYKRYDRKAHFNRIEFDEQLKRGIHSNEQKINTIIFLNNIMRTFSSNIKTFSKCVEPVNELFNEYISITSKLLLSRDFEEINNELIDPIKETFTLLWTFISRVTYFEDLTRYVPVEILKPRMNRGFVESLQDIEISLDVLMGLLPQEEIKPNPKFAKFVGAAKD